MESQAVIITGSSGSGKSSLAKALQEALLPSIWLRFSFDSVIYSLPESVLEQCNLHNNWSGVDGKALFRGALGCLRSLIDCGNNVIFDVVLSKPEDVDHLSRALQGVDVLSAHLRCDWAEIESRTLERGDRTLEEAEWSYRQAVTFSPEALEFDTTNQAPDAIAKVLSARLALQNR